MPRKLTKEEFINREPDILNGDYEFIGEYKGTNIKTLFKHSVCGYEWETRPSDFHQGSRCPKCANQKKKALNRLTKEEFVNRELDLLGGEYSMLGEYINAKTKTLFKHNVCGYEWTVIPYSFHYGRRCPICGGTQKLTKREFCKREDDIVSGEYSMLGDYTSARKKTLFRHNLCGYDWMIIPESFHRGTRCPECVGNIKMTKEEFCEREKDIVSGEYEFVGDYINTRTKTLFRHNTCGYKWETTPARFYSGKRCPKCNQSKGEKIITNILEVLNIPFEAQKKFNTCRYKNVLPFDFYVSNSFLIEYDGEQHFTEVDYFGGEQGLKIRQLRDNIKTQWAKDNGIPLIRIPYTEFHNIEQIIKESIEKYSIQKAG